MSPTLPRRALLATAAASLLAAPARAADPIAAATITPQGSTVTGQARPGPWRIGFSDGYGATPWRRMCLAELQRAVAAQPHQVAQLIVHDAEGDPHRQMSQINDLTRAKVDAILCIPSAADPVAVALANATARGIVTVPFTLPVGGTAWSSYVGTDKTGKGAALAKWLAGALGGRGKVVALGGVPGNPYSGALWAGAQTVWKGTGIEVLRFDPAFWDRERARAVMAGLLGALPVIDGIWCDGGQDAAGALDALLAARRPLLPVTGDDYNGLLKLHAAVTAGGARGFPFGLLSEPTWQSVIALRTATTLLGGGTVSKQQFVLPAMITADNYRQYIRPRLPDAVLVDTTLDDATLQRIFA